MIILSSSELLATLLMAGSLVFFLAVFFPSWYACHPRRFWLARLTYREDSEQQSFVRFMWVLAWVSCIGGSLVWMLILPINGVIFKLLQFLWRIILVWGFAKVIVALSILLQCILFASIRLRNWIFRGSPLFPKYEKIRQLKR